MQLKEILLLLKTTPMQYNIIMIVSTIFAGVSLLLMFKSDKEDNDSAFTKSIISLAVFVATATGFVIYTQSSQNTAIENATITRSEDKIHIESNSEFMKSADLDVVAEKDGYIYVEFDNKTYRIEDLSKKGN